MVDNSLGYVGFGMASYKLWYSYVAPKLLPNWLDLYYKGQVDSKDVEGQVKLLDEEFEDPLVECSSDIGLTIKAINHSDSDCRER